MNVKHCSEKKGGKNKLRKERLIKYERRLKKWMHGANL